MPTPESRELLDAIAEKKGPSTVTPERWAEAISEVRSFLIKRIVESPEPEITYGELSQQVAQDVLRNRGGAGLNWLNARALLGHVSSVEHESGRPMLSVIVVNEKNRKAGSGLPNLARKLKIPVANDEKFLMNEHKPVINYWKEHA